MNTRRYRQYITNAYTLAHNGVQTAIQAGRQVANNYAEQEARGIEMWRYICEQAYPYNERLRNELYEYGINHYKQILQGIGLAAATASRQSINYVQQHFQQMISTGISQISNNPFQHALNWASEGIQNVGEGIQNVAQESINYMERSNQDVLNRAWQAYRRPTHDIGDQTFFEFLRNRGTYMTESYVNSFLNSHGVAQDSMARGANFREIVTAPNGQIVENNNGNSPGLGALAGGFNQGMTQTTTTANPTTTTQTPTTTTATPMERAVGAGPTSGGAHGETGVEMINYTKFHPFKRTEQVLMPYYTSNTLTYPANATSAVALTFRLNSIYDIIHAGATFSNIDPNVTPPTADTPDAALSREVPMMREYWKQFYSYWHVVKCEWKFSYLPSIINMTTNLQNQLFFYEHGIQYPPLTQTVAGTAKLIPWHVRQYHPHVRQQTIKNHGADQQLHSNWQTVSGTWRPGDIQHEVAEDELTRVWHKFEAVPPTAEKLTIMLQSMDGQPLDAGTYNLKYKMEMHYTVQLKDLKTQYEFITEASGIPEVTGFQQRLV